MNETDKGGKRGWDKSGVKKKKKIKVQVSECAFAKFGSKLTAESL